MDGETEKAKAEELKKNEDIRRAFEQTAGNKPKVRPSVEARQKVWIGTYVLVFVFFAVIYYLVRFQYFGVPERYEALANRLAMGAMAIVLILIAKQAARALFIEPLENAAARFNLNSVANLLAALGIFFILLSIVFANWYTAAVSLGLLSLVLGFALQAPIASFIGWIYVIVKVPYRVGDRITIGEASGDVIDVSYLDTTLWEIGGPMIATSNHPSGRIIKFPNSQVLTSTVFNYSWSLFPYIWNDINFHIAYQSDLEFVATVMSETAAEEVGGAMKERIAVYRELLSQTPVDELEVRERPTVIFRVHDNTWIEAIVRYLVEPRRAGTVKTQLIKTMLDRLNAEPDRVMFPKSNLR